MAAITGLAAGNSEPTTTQQISTGPECQDDGVPASGEGPNPGVGLFCCRSIL